MKKILLSACLLASSVFAFAQKPGTGDNSFTFGISGINTISVSAPHYTSSLLFKHYMNNGLAARVGINVGSSNSKTGGYTGNDSLTSKSMAWGLSLGVQRAFKGTEKLETYIGADLLIGGGSSSNTMNDVNSKLMVDTKNGSTFQLGVMPCLGMNYYIASWLAVGAEFSWGYMMTSTGEGTKTTTLAGTATTTKTSKVSSSGLGTAGHGMITVTAAFH